MADAANKGEAQTQAAQALGGAMMGEIAPFPSDNELPDHSDDISAIFGLGEEAGPVPNSPKGGSDGGASPSEAASAAEGGEGQAQQPATPPVQQPTPGQQGEQPQAPAQPASLTPAPAAPPAAPVDGQAQAPSSDPTVQALTAQVQALTAHIAQLQSQLSQPQGAGTPTPQAGPGAQPQEDPLLTQNPLADYRLAIPDDVANAVFNEDPQIARQGMTHLVNSLARMVHDRVIRHADQVVQQRITSYGTQAQLSQQQEQMRQQYYTAFPQHNDPGIQFIVAQEAQQMWAANPNLQWDTNAMNALGARVNARLGATATVVQQPQGQQPAAQGQPAPRPAAQMGSSTRPAANPADNEGTFIENVLSA